MFEARVHQVQHADEIHVHRVGEGLRRQTRGQGADARVGDHDVQMPELGDAGIDGGGQGHAVANVRDRRVRALPFLFDQPRRLVEVLRTGQGVFVGFDVGTQIHRDDVRALGGQHPRVRAALAACGAADDGHLARYSAHRPPFVRPATSRFTLGPNGIRCDGSGPGRG